MFAFRFALIPFWLSCQAVSGAAASTIDVSALTQFPCPDDEGQVDRSFIRHCGHLKLSDGSHNKPSELAVVVLIPPDPIRARRTPTVFVHGGPGIGVVDTWWFIAGGRVRRLGGLLGRQRRPWQDRGLGSEQRRQVMGGRGLLRLLFRGRRVIGGHDDSGALVDGQLKGDLRRRVLGDRVLRLLPKRH